MKLAINEKNVLKLMEATFSSSTTFITELMQNARRAGATKLDITIEEVDGKVNLTFTDDGCGIEDFSNLMTVAQSGWNEETQKEDKPFGAGFLSALLCCEDGFVDSSEQILFWNKQQLLDGQPAAIEISNPRIGTSITLKGVGASEGRSTVHGIAQRIRKSALGFPIPVTLTSADGISLLDRRDSVGVLASSVHVTLPEFGTVFFRPDTRYSGIDFFLQGLPIHVSRSEPQYYCEQLVVHLDSAHWDARMPDRAVLRDISREELERLTLSVCPALAQLYYREVQGKISSESAWKFVADYAPELVKQCTAIPGAIFSGMVDTCASECVKNIFDQTDYYENLKDMVTAEDFRDCEQGRCILLSELPHEGEDNTGGAAYLLVQAQKQHNLRFIKCHYDEKHLPAWVTKSVGITADFTDYQVYATPVEGSECEPRSMKIYFDSSNVEVYRVSAKEGYMLHLRDEAGVNIVSAHITDYDWYNPHDRTLWLVYGQGDGAEFRVNEELFMQDESFMEGEEFNYSWDSEGIAKARNKLEMQLAQAYSEDGHAAERMLQRVILAAVNEALRPYTAMLAGREFLVTECKGYEYSKVVIQVAA